MPNVVIASPDPLCQSAKKWLVDNQGAVDGPVIDLLESGKTLFIVAHDTEMGDASAFLKAIDTCDFPMEANFKIILIVCSAASMSFGKGLLTPAERIANHFQRPVLASKNVVHGTWNATQMTLIGDYNEIPPNTDITSLISKLKL